MTRGLFIDHDFITCFYDDKKTGEIKYVGLGNEAVVYLYYTLNNKPVPSFELKPEARLSYFPGHPGILGEVLKSADSSNGFPAFKGKPVDVFEVLDNTIQQLLDALIKELKSMHNLDKAQPFFLIVPQFIGKELTNKFVASVKKKFNEVLVFRNEFIYINSLINMTLLPENGTALFLDMGTSDLYLNALKFNDDDVKLAFEGKIADTGLVSGYLRLVAGEMVDSARIIYNKTDQVDPAVREKEIEKNLPAAQDILNEIKSIKEWHSIEAEVELSDKPAEQVMIYRGKLQEKFNVLLESEKIDAQLTQLVKSHHPDFILLYGENLENPLLIDYLKKFKDCKIIGNREDAFREICHTFIENIREAEKAEQPVTLEQKPAVKPDSQPASSAIRPSDATLPAIDEIVEPGNGNRKLLYILIPVILIALVVAVYFLFLNKNSSQESTENVAPAEITNQLSATSFVFSPEVGDTQKIFITSAGSWQIDSLPDWLNADVNAGNGSGSVSIYPTMNNENTETRHEQFQVNFDNDNILLVDVSQSGLAELPISIQEDTLKAEETIAKNSPPATKKSDEPDKVNPPEKKQKPVEVEELKIADSLLNIAKWSFDELNAFTESIRNKSGKINYQQLNKFIDPRCEVFTYINNDKTSSESLESFLNNLKLGIPVKLVENSIKYNEDGKIIEFGQE